MNEDLAQGAYALVDQVHLDILHPLAERLVGACHDAHLGHEQRALLHVLRRHPSHVIVDLLDRLLDDLRDAKRRAAQPLSRAAPRQRIGIGLALAAALLRWVTCRKFESYLFQSASVLVTHSTSGFA